MLHLITKIFFMAGFNLLGGFAISSFVILVIVNIIWYRRIDMYPIKGRNPYLMMVLSFVSWFQNSAPYATVGFGIETSCFIPWQIQVTSLMIFVCYYLS